MFCCLNRESQKVVPSRNFSHLEPQKFVPANHKKITNPQKKKLPQNFRATRYTNFRYFTSKERFLPRSVKELISNTNRIRKRMSYPLLPNMNSPQLLAQFQFNDVMMLLEWKVMASSRKQRFTLIKEMAKMMPNFVYISSL